MENNTQQLALINQLATVPLTADIIQSADFSEKYKYLVTLTQYLSDIKRNVDEAIKDIVKENYLETGDSSTCSGGFRYTYVPPTTREVFNTKEFKQDHPELFKEYTKISNVSDSVRVTRVITDESGQQ